MCRALKVRLITGPYVFLEVGRSTEHVRSLLVSHLVRAIVLRALQVKRTFLEIVLTKCVKRNEHVSIKHDTRASN